MKKVLHILLVEDNEGDVILAKEALSGSQIDYRITVLSDGEQAVNFFDEMLTGIISIEDHPDLVLLDINLPKIDGKAVLEKIKGNEESRMIPVVIFTSSDAESDILFAYDHFVNSYVTKPINFDQYMLVVKDIENFWMKTTVLPGNL